MNSFVNSLKIIAKQLPAGYLKKYNANAKPNKKISLNPKIQNKHQDNILTLNFERFSKESFR